MTNLQVLAEAFTIYEAVETERPRDIAKINEAYTNLMKLPGARRLNLKESHVGVRLWFDYGVMCTRFFWEDGVLQHINDSWASVFGPYYYAMIDKETGERHISNRGIKQTWEEYAADAQKEINILLEEAVEEEIG